jgi:hypothetical protein
VQVNTQGVLPDEEGPVEKPFRNPPADRQSSTSRSTTRTPRSCATRWRTRAARTTSTGGNVIESGGALNTNKIHSAIGKNTTVLGASKVNEFTRAVPALREQHHGERQP